MGYKFILATVVLFFTLITKPASAQTFKVADTVLIVVQNQYQKGVIVALKGKKADLGFSDGQTPKVAIKNLFEPYSEPFAVKCRHFDEIVTADVIVDATALGFNGAYTLVLITYNRQTFAAIKHKSQLVKAIKLKK